MAKMNKFEGSKKDMAQDAKLAKKYKMSPKEYEKSAVDAKHDKQKSMAGLKHGGSMYASGGTVAKDGKGPEGMRERMRGMMGGKGPEGMRERRRGMMGGKGPEGMRKLTGVGQKPKQAQQGMSQAQQGGQRYIDLPTASGKPLTAQQAYGDFDESGGFHRGPERQQQSQQQMEQQLQQFRQAQPQAVAASAAGSAPMAKNGIRLGTNTATTAPPTTTKTATTAPPTTTKTATTAPTATTKTATGVKKGGSIKKLALGGPIGGGTLGGPIGGGTMRAPAAGGIRVPVRNTSSSGNNERLTQALAAARTAAPMAKGGSVNGVASKGKTSTKMVKMASGGSFRSSANGIASKGKTKGRMC